MALETLKDAKEIGGFNVSQTVDDVWPTGAEQNYIAIDHECNAIAFKIQDGPIKENGVNGCQVDTLIKTAHVMVEGLNSKFPCQQNENVLLHLDQALKCLQERKRERERRGVEGTSKA